MLAGETCFAELLLGRSFGLVPVVAAGAKDGKHTIEFQKKKRKVWR